jgi:hypothetical protein
MSFRDRWSLSPWCDSSFQIAQVLSGISVAMHLLQQIGEAMIDKRRVDGLVECSGAGRFQVLYLGDHLSRISMGGGEGECVKNELWRWSILKHS